MRCTLNNPAIPVDIWETVLFLSLINSPLIKKCDCNDWVLVISSSILMGHSDMNRIGT